MHGIYHPPYSLTNKVTNSKFIEEFTDYVSTCLPEHPNNIFIGDFNLHVSDELDMDAAIFNDSIDALGQYQHVGFVMHKSGNVLDLIISDLTNSTMVLTTAPGPYVTNHRAVIGTLSIKKLRPKQLTAMVRHKLVGSVINSGMMSSTQTMWILLVSLTHWFHHLTLNSRECMIHWHHRRRSR